MAHFEKEYFYYEVIQDEDVLKIDCFLDVIVDGQFQNFNEEIAIADDASSRKFIDLFSLCQFEFKKWYKQKLEELRVS